MTDTAIDDLKSRLARVRWPDEAPEAPWSFGASLGFVREMIDYWSEGFDWRKTEAGLYAWPQYTTRIDGIAVHFLRVPGKGPAPKPLLLSQGCPGSILEFMIQETCA